MEKTFKIPNGKISEENFHELLVCVDRVDGSLEFFDHGQNCWQKSSISLELSPKQLFCEIQWLQNENLLFSFGGRNLVNNSLNLVWSRNLSDISSQWTSMAPMSKNRSNFSSVVFDNNIYALGGRFKDYYSGNQTLRNCESYDSQQKQWKTIDSLKIARKNASAAVYNNCIYIAGGTDENGVTERSVEKYDFQSKTWNEVTPMNIARSHFALTPFSGRLWAIGGLGGDKQALSSVESYDFMTNKWKQEESLNTGRIGHSAIEFNGELYVVGGFKEILKNAISSYISALTKITENYVSGKGWGKNAMLQKTHPFVELIIANNIKIKNITVFKQKITEINNSSLNEIDQLKNTNNILNKIANNTKSLLVCIDTYLDSVQFYYPQHNSWHTSPGSLTLPNGQYDFQLSLLNSMLYAFGGKDKNNKATNEMWSRDLSDPSSQWTARANMKQNRKRFSSVVLNDTIYALGGKDTNDDLLRSCERYDSQLNEWSTVAGMNSYRIDPSVAVINGCIYVAGGWNKERTFNSVSKYCPKTNTWMWVAPMTTERCVFALTPFAGRFWAIGGVGGYNQLLSSCESYDPVTDTWRKEAKMKEKRYRHAAIAFNGELYVVGGMKSNKSKFGERSNWESKVVKKVVEKYVPTIDRWEKDSNLQETFDEPQLLIIPPACTSIFPTDQSESLYS